MSELGSRSPGRGRTVQPLLQVAHGIDGRPVDAHLEVHVRPEAMSGAADSPDHLALLDALPDAHPDRGLVAVTGGDAAPMLDAGVVAVAADPARDRNSAPRRGPDRCAARHGDVDAGVQPAPAHPKAGHDRAADRPDVSTAALPDGTGRGRR